MPVLQFVFLVTIPAPTHFQRGDPGDSGHGGHVAMAFHTINFSLDVTFVREINEVGQVVNLDPRYGLFVDPVAHQEPDLWPFCRDALVTADALADRGYPGRCGDARLGVAIHARNLVVARVDPVTEIDWLFRCGPGEQSCVRPITEHQPDDTDTEHQPYRPEHSQRRNDRNAHLVRIPLRVAVG